MPTRLTVPAPGRAALLLALTCAPAPALPQDASDLAKQRGREDREIADPPSIGDVIEIADTIRPQDTLLIVTNRERIGSQVLMDRLRAQIRRQRP